MTTHRSFFDYAQPWADVVVDLRSEHERDGLTPDPDLLVAVGGRAVHLPGWTLRPYTHRGGPKGGSTSVLVCDAEDGWSTALVFRQYSGSKFAFAALRSHAPWLGRALSPLSGSAATHRTHLDLATRGVATLRAAVNDPDTWFGDTGPHPDFEPTNWLVEWASCGVTKNASARAFFEYDVRPAAGAGILNNLTLTGWRDAGFDGDSDTAAWMRATDDGDPAAARAFRSAGLSVDDVAQWVATPLALRNAAHRDLLIRWREHGWTPSAVRHLAAAVNGNLTLADHIAEWESDMPGARAALYVCAGISRDDACRFESSQSPPSTDSLRLLAAFVDEPPSFQWSISPMRVAHA